MVSRRSRNTNSVGSRLNGLQSDVEKLKASRSVAPEVSGTPEISVPNGAIGTEQLGLVSEIRSSTGIDFKLPGKISVLGDSYPLPTGVSISTLGLNSSGEVVASASIAGYLLGVAYPWFSDTIPSWGLLLDGRAVSRTTYSGLFAILGTTYGAGDGSTTFNLPDMRGRVPAGYKSGDSNFGTMGAMIGAATHTLTVAEMPAHTHAMPGKLYVNNSAPNEHMLGAGSTAGSPNTGSTGGGDAHNNVQPSTVVHWVICAATSSGDFDTEVQTALVGRVSPSLLFRERVIFTSSGTFSKASYPWLKAVRVELVGGGGGGGGSAAASSNYLSMGGGGGGGGYAEKVIPVASLAASETVTVGAGGSATTGGTGGTGGTSSFGTAVVATGGEGGKVKPNSIYSWYVGGMDGGIGTAGDIVSRGDPGGVGSGYAGLGTGGPGGGSRLGGGKANSGAGAGSGSYPGVNADSYGGGGSGAQTNSGGGAQPGGTGYSGVVIVELYG